MCFSTTTTPSRNSRGTATGCYATAADTTVKAELNYNTRRALGRAHVDQTKVF